MGRRLNWDSITVLTQRAKILTWIQGGGTAKMRERFEIRVDPYRRRSFTQIRIAGSGRLVYFSQ
jgi:hypothetical protein